MRLCAWEDEILEDFNNEDCLNDLLELVPKENHEKFLIQLADSLNTFKNKLIKHSFSGIAPSGEYVCICGKKYKNWSECFECCD